MASAAGQARFSGAFRPRLFFVRAHSTEARRRDAARGALLGTFIGDALGMPFEGMPPSAIPEPVEMVEARLGRGTYTDDTEMMIGLAESLVECGAVDPEHLARSFLEGFDPRRGYGAGTLEVFSLWRGGAPVDHAAARLFDGQGSLGNGGAMRVAPVGVRFAASSEELIEQAALSARVTHTHELGVDSAVAQAAAVAAAVRGEEPLEAAARAVRTASLAERLEEARELVSARPAPVEAAKRLGNSSAGHQSVPLALHAAAAHGDFHSAVTYAVRCGGDTDTVGAMAGAVSGARWGAGAIPARWLDALEDGGRGRTHLERLADRLIES